MNQSSPVLVIMAAGMGSRFGGLKQIEPVDPEGHIIIDFSLFDAWRAGFRDVVFIIKREMEAEFRDCIGNRMEKYFHISYVFQDLDRLPEGISVPGGRTKPWGTGDGEHFFPLMGDTIVSMNLWGFSAHVLDELWARMGAFLTEAMKTNPLKCEYFLPFVVNEQLADKSATVRVLPCEESWYGVTYREDLASVKDAITKMKSEGIYTEELWG